jgi:hypothetical protein
MRAFSDNYAPVRAYLVPLAPQQILNEWFAIRRILGKAMDRDSAVRSPADIAVQTMSGRLRYWRVVGSGCAGYMTTTVSGKEFWVIYIGGKGGNIDDKRAVLEQIEILARMARCTEVRFVGRGWRKLFPDYEAQRDRRGRWSHRKTLPADF